MSYILYINLVNFGKIWFFLENVPMENMLKIAEIAEYLRISKEKVYKLAQQGKIPASKIGSQWRFNRRRVDQWLKRQDRCNN